MSSDSDKMDDTTLKFFCEFKQKFSENATNVLIGEKLLPESEGMPLSVDVDGRVVALSLNAPRVGKEGFLLGVVTITEALVDSTNPYLGRKTNSEVLQAVAARLRQPKSFLSYTCTAVPTRTPLAIVAAYSGNQLRIIEITHNGNKVAKFCVRPDTVLNSTQYSTQDLVGYHSAWCWAASM